MAKKLVAVTAIKHDGETYDAGTQIDPTKFTREELAELHDNGALVVSDDAKADDVKAENLTPAELGQSGAQMQDVSATAKESTAATANAGAKADEKATPAKK